VDVRAWSADLLSLSAHKFYGPKGIGALFVSRGGPPVRLSPLFDGGGHERGLRSGTVPVPLVVGLGAAAEIAGREFADEAVRVGRLRDRLLDGLTRRLDGIGLNGHRTERLPGNLNVRFEGLDGDALMMAMEDVAVSSGAACSSAEAGPSHVLTALGLSEPLARASLRFGVGRFNTEDEIDFAIDHVARAVERLRAARATEEAGGRLGFDPAL
jgi:cysteine desulfurase